MPTGQETASWRGFVQRPSMRRKPFSLFTVCVCVCVPDSTYVQYSTCMSTVLTKATRETVSGWARHETVAFDCSVVLIVRECHRAHCPVLPYLYLPSLLLPSLPPLTVSCGLLNLSFRNDISPCRAVSTGCGLRSSRSKRSPVHERFQLLIASAEPPASATARAAFPLLFVSLPLRSSMSHRDFDFDRYDYSHDYSTKRPRHRPFCLHYLVITHNALSFLSLQCREKKEKESEPQLPPTDQIQSAATTPVHNAK